MVAAVEYLRHDRLRIRGGATFLPLVLHQERAKLLRRHVVPATGVLDERRPHLRRGLPLGDLELPAEASEHAVVVVVTPHFALSLSLRSLSLSLTMTLYIYIQQNAYTTRRRKCYGLFLGSFVVRGRGDYLGGSVFFYLDVFA